MIPEEKAKYLLNKFLSSYGRIDSDAAQECLTIAVDEIMSLFDIDDVRYHYWKEVKRNIYDYEMTNYDNRHPYS